MYSLVIDSSTKILYIGLAKDNKLLDEYYIKGQNDHAKNIVYKIDELLKKYDLNSSMLDEVVCGYGPGSYTGVRMSVTVAKMLSVFMNKPLYVISTLKLMASGLNGVVLSQIDARRGNSFACVLDLNKNEYVLDEGMYENDVLATYKVDSNALSDDYKVNIEYVLNNKVKVDEPHLLTPNYLRETEAERNLK